MAMPYMEEAANPERWLQELARRSLALVPAKQLVFELQTRDWRVNKPVPDDVLVEWIDILKQQGIRNIGYYPDDFHNNQPDTRVLRPHFSLGKRFGVYYDYP